MICLCLLHESFAERNRGFILKKKSRCICLQISFLCLLWAAFSHSWTLSLSLVYPVSHIWKVRIFSSKTFPYQCPGLHFFWKSWKDLIISWGVARCSVIYTGAYIYAFIRHSLTLSLLLTQASEGWAVCKFERQEERCFVSPLNVRVLTEVWLQDGSKHRSLVSSQKSAEGSIKHPSRGMLGFYHVLTAESGPK